MVEGKVAQGDGQGRCQHASVARSFLGGKELATITRATLDKIADEKLARGCSNATVNRTLELVRAILRKCVNEWEWLDRAPQVRMLREPTRRIRFLTQEEAQRLLTELPEHLADMAAFSLATGLRAANVTGLQWSQVDLTRQLAWIHPDQAKARRRSRCRSMPKRWRWCRSRSGSIRRTCSASAASRSRRSARKPGTRRWSGPVSRISAGTICGTTWASWHVQNGTPLFALQELGGWESAEMVRRYAHLAADHLAPYAERLGALRAVEAIRRHVYGTARKRKGPHHCKPLIIWLRGSAKRLINISASST